MISLLFILSQILDLIHHETYLLVAILHKKLKMPESLHRNLQILSIHPFEKIAFHEMLMKNDFKDPEVRDFNQMRLFDL